MPLKLISVHSVSVFNRKHYVYIHTHCIPITKIKILQGMIQQLVSGPSLAMEITSIHGADTPTKFREFVGPSDPVSCSTYFNVLITCTNVCKDKNYGIYILH